MRLGGGGGAEQERALSTIPLPKQNMSGVIFWAKFGMNSRKYQTNLSQKNLLLFSLVKILVQCYNSLVRYLNSTCWGENENVQFLLAGSKRAPPPPPAPADERGFQGWRW